MSKEWGADFGIVANCYHIYYGISSIITKIGHNSDWIGYISPFTLFIISIIIFNNLITFYKKNIKKKKELLPFFAISTAIIGIISQNIFYSMIAVVILICLNMLKE